MKRALVVEDDPVWAGILSTYCRKEGYDSVLVRSPQEAMNCLDEGGIDVVILDMLLAVETGVALLNEMRSFGDLSRIPVIVCTGSDATQEDLSSFGVVAVLDKTTMDAQDLRVELRKLHL